VVSQPAGIADRGPVGVGEPGLPQPGLLHGVFGVGEYPGQPVGHPEQVGPVLFEDICLG
jgi:hypothetical protein